MRDVASAFAANDDHLLGTTILALRRVCWLTGLLGAITMLLLSPWLSQLSFGTTAYQWDIAALGIIILLGNVQGGQMAVIQGTRRIADMARVQIIGAVLGTVVTIGFYLWLGLRGIVPALVLMAVVQLIVSWRFASRVQVPVVMMSWIDSLRTAGSMVRLGLSMMWTGMLGSAVGYATNALITQQINLQAVGIYSAAFALSGVFVNFILGAMSADYYPRLAGVAHDKEAMNRLVNEQTEIGLLLAAPGLLATLSLAPWIVQIFYTREFLLAAELLPWFILGCLGRVISWPLGFMMLAMRKGLMFTASETFASFVHLIFIAVGVFILGLKGVAVGFFWLYVIYTVQVLIVASYLTGFRWSGANRKLIAITSLTTAITFLIVHHLSLWPGTLFSLAVTLASSVLCLRALVRRIGNEHRYIQTTYKVPGMRYIIGAW